METKNILPSKALLWHHFKEKRSWFILTVVLLMVTVVIIPLLLFTDLVEGIVFIGIFEVFVVVFIMCIMDFNYLHDQRKFGYYASKPLSQIQKMNLVYITNLTFASIFMTILAIISTVASLDLQILFVMPVAWMVVIIFLTGLSSYLSGNSLIAAIATWFNFGIPIFFLGSIYFAMEIVQNIGSGFNVSIMMDYFIQTYYRLDILYFMRFNVEMNFLTYTALIFVLSTVIYTCTLWVIKYRKNERIGQHIIFNGYKNFIALLTSMLVPLLFTTLMRSGGYIGKLMAFVILGSITYYIALVILEKSFKLKKSAYKILTIFMICFIAIVLLIGFIVKNYDDKLPNIDEVKGVLISNTQWFYSIDEEDHKDLSTIELEDESFINMKIYTSKEAIQGVMDIHTSIAENANYHSYVDVNIIYFMENGKKIRRYYNLEPRLGDENLLLDEISENLQNTSEFKEKMLPFVYDDEYAFRYLNSTMKIDEASVILTEERFNELRGALKKDAEFTILTMHMDFNSVVGEHNFNYLAHRGIESKVEVSNYETLYISIYDDVHPEERLVIPAYFAHTRAYLKGLIKN